MKTWNDTVRLKRNGFYIEHDAQFEIDLLKRLNEKIEKTQTRSTKMAIKKTWDDVKESTGGSFLLPEQAGVIGHVYGVLFKDNVPDNPKWKNYKEGDAHDEVQIIYAIDDTLDNFPDCTLDGAPYEPSGDTILMKAGFPETLSFSKKSNHLATLKAIFNNPKIDESTLREMGDLETVYTSLIGKPVFCTITHNKSTTSEKVYNQMTIAAGNRLPVRTFTEALEVPEFLLEGVTDKILAV